MILREDNKDKIKNWSGLSGVVWEENNGDKITWDVKKAAQTLTKAVGVKTVRDLHKASRFLDVTLVFLAFFLWIGIGLIVAQTKFGWYTVPLLFIQGAVIINFFYALRHDVFMHRQLGGSKAAYIFGILLSLPMMNTYTRFLLHADHHFHVGHDLFEEHIAELDKKWKRWFGLTLLGFIFLFSGKLRSVNHSSSNKAWQPPAVFLKAKKMEQRILWIWILGLIVVTIIWPYQMIMAYWIPFILIVPLIAAIKNSLQHAETDVNNPFHASSFFKSNWFVRIFFCCSTGELHLIHHIFPHIPFYKTPKAARIFRAELIKQGVPQRKLLQVLWGYYIKGEPYRQRWTTKPLVS